MAAGRRVPSGSPAAQPPARPEDGGGFTATSGVTAVPQRWGNRFFKLSLAAELWSHAAPGRPAAERDRPLVDRLCRLEATTPFLCSFFFSTVKLGQGGDTY